MILHPELTEYGFLRVVSPESKNITLRRRDFVYRIDLKKKKKKEKR